jgi:hypothetical protein
MELSRDFEIEGSLGQQLTDQFDKDRRWSHAALLVFATLCSELADVAFPRNWKRNRRMIYKWLTDHYSEIAPVSMLAPRVAVIA